MNYKECKKNVKYKFSSFVVEEAERRIWRENELISLTPKAFDTLVVLLKNKGKVVEKDVIFNEVWQNTFVEESTLSQNISTLRRTLGTLSDGKPFIETVSRHGYRFIAQVEEFVEDEEAVEHGEYIVVERRRHTQISSEHEEFSNEQERVESFTDLQPAKNNHALWTYQNFLHHRLPVLISITVGLLLLAGIFLGINYYSQPIPLVTTAFNQITVTKLTSNGNIRLVTASPDGNYLAFVENRDDDEVLLLRQIHSFNTIEIIPPKKQEFVGITFTPDAAQIFFVKYEKANNSSGAFGKLYRVSTLGGPIQQIADDVDSPVAISPDGKKIAFVRNYLDEEQSVIITLNLETGEESRLTARKFPELFLPTGLAWSPDGKMLVAPAHESRTQVDLLVIKTDSGQQTPLASGNWQWIGHPNWLADGSGIIFCGFSLQSGNQTDELWQVSYPAGVPRKINGDISGALGLSLTSNSKELIAIKSDRLTSFWTSDTSDLIHSAKITQNLTDFNIKTPGITWTPDGKILYGATLNGNLDIWMMSADGSHNKQITTDNSADSMPVVSPDGQDVFFVSNRSGRLNLWQMKIDGSEQKQLTDEDKVNSPSLTPDGKSVLYTSLDNISLKPYLRKFTLDGGKLVQLTSQMTLYPRISPDGKSIACYYPDASKNSDLTRDLRITILSTENGKVIKQFPTVFNDGNLSSIEWFDNSTITYLFDDGNGSQIWRQSIDNKVPQKILDSRGEHIYRFAWSVDKKKLIYEKSTIINDIVLVKSVSN